MKHTFHPTMRRYAVLARPLETAFEQRHRPAGEVFRLCGCECSVYDPARPYANPALDYDGRHYRAFGVTYGRYPDRPSGFGDCRFISGEGFYYNPADEPSLFSLYCPQHDAHPAFCGCDKA